jgi:hypothetical protein
MPIDSEQRPVTRIEIIDALEGVFDGRQLTRQELVDTANDRKARLAVVDALGRLPDRGYWQPQQLWFELPEVPVEP